MIIRASVDASEVQRGLNRGVEHINAFASSAQRIMDRVQPAQALTRNFATAGHDAAEALVHSLSDTLSQQQSTLREALFRGSLNPAQFKAAGVQSAAGFNQGLLQGIDALRSKGLLDSGAYQRIVSQFKDAGLRSGQAFATATAAVSQSVAQTGTGIMIMGRNAAPALTRTAFAFEGLARSAEAGSAGVRAAANSVAMFAASLGPGGVIVSAVIAGGLAISSLFGKAREEMNRTAREFRDRTNDMINVANAIGLVSELQKLETGLPSAGISTAAPGAFKGGIADLTAQIGSAAAARASALNLQRQAALALAQGETQLFGVLAAGAKIYRDQATQLEGLLKLRAALEKQIRNPATIPRAPTGLPTVGVGGVPSDAAQSTGMERLAERVKLLGSAVSEAAVGTEFWRKVVALTATTFGDVAAALAPFGSAVSEQTVALRKMATELQSNIDKLLRLAELAKLPAISQIGILPGIGRAEITPSLPQRPPPLAAGGGMLSSALAGAMNLAATGAQAFAMAIGPTAIVLKFVGDILAALGPALGAFLEPLKIIATALGQALQPVLKALFPVIKLFGIAIAVAGEVVFRVAQAIWSVIGLLIKGLGKLINWLLPGNPANGLVKLGESMLRTAHEFGESAKLLAQARKDIAGLTWDEAIAAQDNLAESANAAAEALRNVPSGFRVQLARYLASEPVPSGRSGVPGAGATGTVIHINAPMTVQTEAKSAEVLFADIAKAAQQRSRAIFGTTVRAADTLALSGA